jgi:hypothetical protein
MAEEAYLIKHKDTDVGKIIINKNNYNIKDVEIYNSCFSPINTSIPRDEQLTDINQWLSNRCIPNTRQGADQLKLKYKVIDLRELMIANLGLSLSDHYWIVKEKESHTNWNSVNFFDNGYSENVDDGYNPDFSLNGILIKRWSRHKSDNKDYLIKGASEPFEQEPFNEYFASMLLDQLKINHVKYELVAEKNNFVSICPCIIDKDTEMVSMFDIFRKNSIYMTYNKNNRYENILNLLNKEFLLTYKDELHKMIVADYVIRNTDRHLNNFGILRNANSGEWISAIPLFDNGCSLWNNENIKYKADSKCSSFAETNEECIKLVNINDYINKEQLINMIDIFDFTFKDYNNTERKNQIKNGLIQRRERIYEYLGG